MKTVLKAYWYGKRVTVTVVPYYLQNGFNASFRMRIKVADNALLPQRYMSGSTHKANIDIVKSVGGLPSYVARVLNTAAIYEQRRRAQPIKEQLSLF